MRMCLAATNEKNCTWRQRSNTLVSIHRRPILTNVLMVPQASTASFSGAELHSSVGPNALPSFFVCAASDSFAHVPDVLAADTGHKGFMPGVTRESAP